MKMSPDRQIDVEWSVDIADTYPVKILVRSYDRVGLLADITANISKNGANILSANTETRESKIVDSLFTIAVENTDHLNRVLSAIRKVKYIQDVRRIDR
jgi:guanosine-3',5'-bis(diphosphate) 3'-pyrophosphohydrolase